MRVCLALVATVEMAAVAPPHSLESFGDPPQPDASILSIVFGPGSCSGVAKVCTRSPIGWGIDPTRLSELVGLEGYGVKEYQSQESAWPSYEAASLGGPVLPLLLEPLESLSPLGRQLITGSERYEGTALMPPNPGSEDSVSARSGDLEAAEESAIAVELVGSIGEDTYRGLFARGSSGRLELVALGVEYERQQGDLGFFFPRYVGSYRQALRGAKVVTLPNRGARRDTVLFVLDSVHERANVAVSVAASQNDGLRIVKWAYSKPGIAALRTAWAAASLEEWTKMNLAKRELTNEDDLVEYQMDVARRSLGSGPDHGLKRALDHLKPLLCLKSSADKSRPLVKRVIALRWKELMDQSVKAIAGLRDPRRRKEARASLDQTLALAVKDGKRIAGNALAALGSRVTVAGQVVGNSKWSYFLFLEGPSGPVVVKPNYGVSSALVLTKGIVVGAVPFGDCGSSVEVPLVEAEGLGSQ